MFNLSPEKILVVGVLALVVLGPTRLPQAARTLARLLVEVRRMSSSFQTEVRGALAEPHDALNKTIGDLGLSELRSPGKAIRSTITDAVNPFTEAPAPRQASGGDVVAASGPADTAPAEGGPPPPPDDPGLN